MPRIKMTYINSQRLVSEMKKQGVKVSSLSQQCGIGEKTIERARKDNQISATNLETIAHALNLSPDYLSDKGDKAKRVTWEEYSAFRSYRSALRDFGFMDDTTDDLKNNYHLSDSEMTILSALSNVPFRRDLKSDEMYFDFNRIQLDSMIKSDGFISDLKDFITLWLTINGYLKKEG